LGQVLIIAFRGGQKLAAEGAEKKWNFSVIAAFSAPSAVMLFT